MVQRIFTKGTKTMNGEKIIFSINVLKQVTSTYRKKRPRYRPFSSQKLTQNGAFLKVMYKAIKLLKENGRTPR